MSTASAGVIRTVEVQAQVAQMGIGDHNQRLWSGLKNAIADSPPFWFADEFVELALAQPPIDLEWHNSLLPSERGFALLGIPAIHPDLPEGRTRQMLGATVACIAFWWGVSREDVMVAFLVRNPEGRTAVLNGVWAEGETLSRRVAPGEQFPRDLPEHSFRAFLPLFAQLVAMAGQRIARVSPTPLPRQLRKRGWASQSGGAVKVIHLRPQESSQGTERGDVVDWSMRWVVRGHWRQQWYPATATHKPLWIQPYVKGPDDKPLQITPKRFAVDRWGDGEKIRTPERTPETTETG